MALPRTTDGLRPAGCRAGDADHRIRIDQCILDEQEAAPGPADPHGPGQSVPVDRRDDHPGLLHAESVGLAHRDHRGGLGPRRGQSLGPARTSHSPGNRPRDSRQHVPLRPLDHDLDDDHVRAEPGRPLDPGPVHDQDGARCLHHRLSHSPDSQHPDRDRRDPGALSALFPARGRWGRSAPPTGAEGVARATGDPAPAPVAADAFRPAHHRLPVRPALPRRGLDHAAVCRHCVYRCRHGVGRTGATGHGQFACRPQDQYRQDPRHGRARSHWGAGSAGSLA